MATKKFLIEVEEGETYCDACPIEIAGHCSRFKINSTGLNCNEYNLATMKIKEYEDKD